MITPIDFLNTTKSVLKKYDLEELEHTILVYFDGDVADWPILEKDKDIKSIAESLMKQLYQEKTKQPLKRQVHKTSIVAMRWSGGIVVLAIASEYALQILQSTVTRIEAFV